MSDEITITIKVQSGEEFKVTISSEATVLKLKQACVAEGKLKVDEQRLIFKGKILKDDMVIADYKIENGVTVHLV